MGGAARTGAARPGQSSRQLRACSAICTSSIPAISRPRPTGTPSRFWACNASKARRLRRRDSGATRWSSCRWPTLRIYATGGPVPQSTPVPEPCATTIGWLHHGVHVGVDYPGAEDRTGFRRRPWPVSSILMPTTCKDADGTLPHGFGRGDPSRQAGFVRAVWKRSRHAARRRRAELDGVPSTSIPISRKSRSIGTKIKAAGPLIFFLFAGLSPKTLPFLEKVRALRGRWAR